MSPTSIGNRLVPALLVRDLRVTLDFYRGLGFRLTGCHPSAAAPTWVELARDGVTLQFHTNPPRGTPAAPICSGRFTSSPRA